MADGAQEEPAAGPLTLSIDIGGSHVKAGVLNPAGLMTAGPARIPTPQPARPSAMVAALVAMVTPLAPHDRVSIGFPGVVRHGVVLTAPNLGTAVWQGFPLASVLAEHLGKPARLLNDATIQGLGVIAQRGVECVLTMGTGMGFALFRDGQLGPHLEMGQHPVKTDRTYDRYVGAAALKRVRRRRWNQRVRKTIALMQTLTNFDTLYIGGGNAGVIEGRLPDNVRIVSNKAGITGGVRLWDSRMDDFFAGQLTAFHVGSQPA